MDISVLINQMITLFLMMFLGFILYKVQIMTDAFNQQVTRLILHVTTPCLILSSVLDDSADLEPQTIAVTFLVAILMYLLLPLFSKLITFLIRAPKNQQGIYDFMGIYANVGYMGFPVIASLYGSSALLITAIFNIVFNISGYSIGVLTICRSSEEKAVMTPKKLLSPGIILSCLSVVIYLAQIRFPMAVTNAISSIGSLTTPLAMLMIGATLAKMNFKEMIGEKRIYAFTLLRQIVFPLLCWPVLKLCIQDTLLLAVTFLLLIMPVGNISVLFATNYNLDAKLAAKGVFITTLLSIVSIPLLFYLCMHA